MRKLFLTLALCLTFCRAFSIGGIKGQIVDAQTKEPIEFVTVSINTLQGEFTGGTVTDASGLFMVSSLEPGQYTISIALLGYKPLERKATVGNSLVNLGRILFEEDSKLMEEVQVTGLASTMRFDIDKKVFSVGSDIASKGASASEILENIPSIEVDQDGAISLRGNSSVTVWINGKPSGLTADNQGDILEQMPAETIERVEVITNPGAKYSAEGTAGIINIILKEDAATGYYGSIQAGAGLYTNPLRMGGYNTNGSINFNSGKWSGYASLGLRSRSRITDNQTDRTYDDLTFLNQDGEGVGGGTNLFFRGGLNYRLTSKDEIGFGTFGMLGRNRNETITDYLSNVPGFYTDSRRTALSEGTMKGYNFDMMYQHKFAEEHTLDFLASYNSWGRDGSTTYSQKKHYIDDSVDSTYQKQVDHVTPHDWNFQLDYSNKLNESCKVEAGYKGTISHEDSPVETISGTSAENAVNDPSLWNRFIYHQQIHAVYGSWSQNISNFGYQLGLRGEYTDMYTQSLGFGQSTDDVDLYKNQYFKLFPTLFLTYRLTENDELQFNYTRRIRRPFGGQLNSFLNITDSANISYGNPYLMPEYANSYELNYIKMWDDMRQTLSFSLYYRDAEDLIQRISYLDGLIMKSSSANIGTSTSVGSEIVAKNKIGQAVDLTTTLNLYYYHLDAYDYEPPVAPGTHIIGEAQSDFNWNARIIGNVMLPKDWSLQVRGDYRAKTIVAQGYRLPTYRIDGGVRKSIGKWSMNLNVRDALNSFKFRTNTQGTGYEQVARHWHGGRRVNLTLSYSFGNMKPQPKKQKEGNRGEDEDGEGFGGGFGGGMED